MMKMLPALAPDTSITENGHYLVRPANGDFGDWPRYEVLNTVTDEVYSKPDEDGLLLNMLFSMKSQAETKALALAQQAIDNA